ncbi:S8 family serine peptidase [Ideonella paludis]|uniref:S8 family serine peptidase n=1 Tax=Ideonella paludis TaxID=1233411 RepID=A0ABS5DX60_9BURK|nr:S8 family serine peptidase [Ideonella paludis]MBQ0935659.1 S8 family serine peptidase [Ideonella paludis]
MKLTSLSLAVATLTVSLMSAGSTLAADATPAASRTVITQADQLPRRTVTLPKLPSELLAVPLAELQAIAAPVEKNLLADLQRYDIQDPATQREYYAALAAMAQLRGDWAAVPQWTAKGRALQEKAGGKLTSGLLTDLLSQQRAEGRDAAWLQAEVQRRYGALPWADVQAVVKANKGGIETFNPELIKGAFQSQVDAVAKNGQMTIPEGLVTAIVNSRMQLELLAANKQAVVAGLQAVIDAQAQAVAKPDIWTPRTFAIPATAPAQPVVVGIWDSGVDLALFKTAAAKGMAFDDDAKPSPHLLRPLGEAQGRWPELRAVIKGAMDQRAALDTPESRAFRAKMAGLKADQVKAFSEDASLAGLYVHGTHVAGIAVDGNPFAQVYAATMLWSHLNEPFKPNEDRSKATAAAYTAMVQGFKKAGVKVVNMSWRYGPSAYESAMAYHNMGGSPEARKQEAQRLFKIERDALHQAIAGAPEIFFVAGSGNEDNSADFEEYIPAGFSLPNLITVGAVDKAGTETSFSTFGKTVAVHANGFEVEAPVPGGVRMKLSGTSMASPQVANLAAKLLALKPGLTPVQLKTAILDGAERQAGADGKPGRVNLINPRKSAALVGIAL